MKRWPMIVAIAMLLITWGLMRSLSYSEPILLKKPFSEFPFNIAERWEGKELGLDQSVLDVLKLTDYMMRVYRKTDDKSFLPVWLYVGYYQSQRTGSTYHSPKNCLPGAGWQFVEAEEVSLPVPGKKDVVINKVLIEKGLDRQIVLYWYYDRNRVIASEYWAKGYMIWDAITQHRTDGSLVRLSVPVATTPEAAYRLGMDFIRDVWPLLEAHMA
jgi:EpsI family protein